MSLVEYLPTLQIILSRYVLLICCFLGFIGCVLNILIFLRKSLRSNTCAVYMLAISIVNLIEIPYALVRVTVYAFLPREARTRSAIYCKFIIYFQHYLLNVVRTYTVLACIDRFALCSSIPRVRHFSSLALARKLVVIMTIVWLIIPLHINFFYGSILTGQCGVSGVYGIFFSIYSAIVTGGHLLLMVIFSSLTICNLRKARLRVQPIRGQSTRSTEFRKKDFQLIKMLFAEVISYVLTSAMFPIFTIYTVAAADVPKSSSRVAVEAFMAFLVPDFLVVITPCTTFYVNLCASKTFRKLCRRTILCKWRARVHSQTTELVERRRKTGVHGPTRTNEGLTLNLN